MTRSFDREQAHKAQVEYCKDEKLPRFSPYDGICFLCGRDIYSPPHGYSVEEASCKLITACPYCLYSFCE